MGTWAEIRRFIDDFADFLGCATKLLSMENGCGLHVWGGIFALFVPCVCMLSAVIIDRWLINFCLKIIIIHR
jgi:hypothetical protein